MEQFRRKSSSESGVRFLERALSGFTIQRSTGTGHAGTFDNVVQESADDIKGPLGLNLLYAPSEPLIDFIFVHGLGGGSRKTWSRSSHPFHYWPKEWLPRDPDFQNVRIHAFGYKADWVEKRDSVLDIHDFARSLLGELKDNPDIKIDDTRIVFVGHSMGGLVIKEVCILAGQDPAFDDLAKRFHTAYFLATPHRGSDLAKLLTNIIKVSYGQKPYVYDLQRNSGAISAINDGFRHYSKDLQLWSFYETQKSSLLISDTMIVDKSSATLGYPHERVAPLNADHRGVCKFDGPSDANYKTLRNAFSTTVDDIITKVSKLRNEASRDEMRRLKAMLGKVDGPVDDLATLDEARTAGSCEWFTSGDEFENWFSVWSEAPPILWLSGNPASGKSVLASHVINHLEGHNLQPSYFFFKHGTATRSTVSACLRSLAYQMIIRSPEIRKRLLDLEADGISLDENGEQSIWRKLFLGGIFQAKFVQPHYWVIDALDECTKFQSLITMISKIEKQTPIRIFITSRKTQDIERSFSELEKRVTHQEMTVSDTVDDIKLFITPRIHELPGLEDDSRQHLIDRILSKSQGCFLWVRLVVQELSSTWSEEAIEEVLNDIPSDMNLLYARTLEIMSRDRGSLKLAKAMLTWATCAARPLTINELQCALKFDIKETVHNLEKSVASVCGQLLFVDQNLRVQVIHQTARDFILQQDQSAAFSIRRAEGNLRLVLTCLEFLSGDYFKPARAKKPKLGVKSGRAANDSALASYACTYFSDHLFKASSVEPEAMDALYNFLNSNVLSWVEYLAQTGDLYHITRTATNMKTYLERRAKYFPPIGLQLHTVESWIVDLIRVSAKFRTGLLSSPSSIHRLVPPMCPKDSIIAKKFTSPHRGLLVKGITATWDDCLTQIDYRGCQATAIACGDRYFAVGLSTGKVMLYHKVSCQLYRSMDHGERVKVLSFSNSDKFLASSGLFAVRVWDISNGVQISNKNTPHQALDLAFSTELDCLMAATQGNYIKVWGLQDTDETAQIPWHSGLDEQPAKIRHQQPPSIAVFSADINFVAICCRGQPILLFDLESETLVGHCSREITSKSQGASSHCPVVSLAFNPDPEINLLVAAYLDGELILYDLWTLGVRQRLPNVNAHTINCSPDGHTLVTGSSFGTIQIFDFARLNGENLTLIYRINAYAEGIRALAFSNDSLRFFDIRGSQCRIWEPAVLVRKDIHDGNQSEVSDPAPLAPTIVGMREGEIMTEITAMTCHPNGDVVFCGKQDGSVAVFSTEDGDEVSILYKHATNIAIPWISWGARENILATADQSGRVILKRINGSQSNWSSSDDLTDIRFEGSIVGLLIDPLNKFLLISGRDRDELWSCYGEKIHTLVFTPESYRRPICHPLQPDVFVIFGSEVARIYRWTDFKEVTKDGGIQLARATKCIAADPLSTISYQGHTFLVELLSVMGNRSSSRLEVWRTSDIRSDAESITALPGFEMLGPKAEHIIAVVEAKLIFLDTDLWVCSMDLKSFAVAPVAKRHFFIPPDWRSSTGELLFQLTPRNEFVFAKRNELLVIKRGLESSEILSLSMA